MPKKYAPKKRTSNPKIIHKMAVRIQQSFWYAKARWATKHRLAKRMLRIGFEYKTPENGRLELDSFVPILFTATIQETLHLWLRKVLMMNRATINDVGGTTSRLLAAYTFAMYGVRLVPLTMEHTPALITIAERLSILMTSMMQCDLYSKPMVTKLVNMLRNFLAVYSIWHSKNQEGVKRLLIQQALFHVHETLSQRLTVADNKAALMLRLFKKYSAVLCEPIEIIKDIVLGCNEMKLVRSLPNSNMWGPGNLSVFRLMHELLMDENFKITVETTIPKFSNKYSRIPTSPIAVTSFLTDLRAVIMWPLREGEQLMDIAEALDVENMQWPEDTKAIASRLVPLICNAIPNAEIANGIRDQWQSMDAMSNEQILAFLRDAALKLRFVYGSLDQEQCRRNIRRHSSGFYQTAANALISKATQTKWTERWLQHTLETCPHKALERIALGDPFAALGLHDQMIVGFALEGDFVSPAPEILLFDVPRLQLIHASVGLLGESEEANAKLRTTLQRLIDEDEDGDSPLAQAAAQLRNIIFVSRFQHGEMFSNLARDVASRLMEANKMLGITRLRDMATEILK